MFIDTHCHVNMMVKETFDTPLQEEHYPLIVAIIAEAQQAGVEKIINIGTSLIESNNSVQIAKRFAGIWATVGIHPCDSAAAGDLKTAIAALRGMLEQKEANKIVGIGEVGLDFFHKPYDKQKQIDFLKAQIELALEFELPLVIHVRDAAQELLKELEVYRKDRVRGVFHCFLQPADIAAVVVDWGFYVGLDGPITYPKNDALRALFKTLPPERIVLETDAPFLPPQQFRGKQNRPAYVPLIAQAYSKVRLVDEKVIEQTTTANAEALFGI